jgi:hypothetical protein
MIHIRAYVIGIQSLDFVGSDNKHIKGIKIHLSYPDQYVEGRAVKSYFLSSKLHGDLKISVGENIDLDFNHRGALLGVRKLSTAKPTIQTQTTPPIPPASVTKTSAPVSELTKSNLLNKEE